MARALSHSSSLSKLNPHFPPSASTFSSPSCMLITTPAQHQKYWASIEAEIEAHLKRAIPVRPPTQVFEPMQSLVTAAPRNKAAALCVAACELVGGDRGEASVVAAAAALQLVHAAVHTHEQLPLTNRPSLNPNLGPKSHAYRPGVELLTGDGILPFGFELLARSVDATRKNSDRVLRVVVEISRAAGSQRMVAGQWKEIEISQSDGSGDEWIGHLCEKKEGELHACGAACGAILGGGNEEEIERLRKCGLYMGIIQGMMNLVRRKSRKYDKGFEEEVKEVKALAVEELESFKGRNIHPIATLVDALSSTPN